MPLRGRRTVLVGRSDKWIRLFDPLRAFVCGSSVVSLTSFDFV